MENQTKYLPRELDLKFGYKCLGIEDVLPLSEEQTLNFPSKGNWAESFGRSGSNH